MDHTVLPANVPHMPLPHSSPEGATSECTVIALADEARACEGNFCARPTCVSL